MATVRRGAKLMVSYGGKIERCCTRGGGGGEGRIKYVGGEHRIVEVSRSVSLRGLRDRLAAVAGFPDPSVQYALSGEGPDALRDVATDDDVRCLLDMALRRDLLVRLLGKDPAKIPRVRVFLARVEVMWPPPASEAPPAPAPMRRRATAPSSLAAKATDDVTQPSEALAAPAVMRRSATAPSLSTTSTHNTASSTTTTTTSSAAGTTSSIQETGRDTAAIQAAEQRRSLACPAPVFLVAVAPVIVYQPAIIVVPAFSCSMVVGLCHA